MYVHVWHICIYNTYTFVEKESFGLIVCLQPVLIYLLVL